MEQKDITGMPEKNNGEIVLYQPDDSISIEVRINQDTVWLNRQQLAMLFDRDVKTIGKHINNALKEELSDVATIAKFATVQVEGSRIVNRTMEYYNLDMVLSVGYRVKSDRGIKYRRWANRVLKEFLLKGYTVNSRLDNLEQRVSKTEEKIDFFVRTSLPPQQGIFYDGQVFDAYQFVSDLIRKAQKQLCLLTTSLMTLEKWHSRDCPQCAIFVPLQQQFSIYEKGIAVIHCRHSGLLHQ